MYICRYVYMHICIYAYMYMYICTYAYMYVCVSEWLSSHMHHYIISCLQDTCKFDCNQLVCHVHFSIATIYYLLINCIHIYIYWLSVEMYTLTEDGTTRLPSNPSPRSGRRLEPPSCVASVPRSHLFFHAHETAKQNKAQISQTKIGNLPMIANVFQKLVADWTLTKPLKKPRNCTSPLPTQRLA